MKPVFVHAPSGGSWGLGSGGSSCKISAEKRALPGFAPPLSMDSPFFQPLKVPIMCDESIRLELESAIGHSESEGLAAPKLPQTAIRPPGATARLQMAWQQQQLLLPQQQKRQRQRQQQNTELDPQVRLQPRLLSKARAWLQAQSESQAPPPPPPLPAQRRPRSRARYGPQNQDTSGRWWASSESQLLCPLTQFPIRLLPYPPFKLRLDPNNSGAHRLMDGKFLAMQIISTGSHFAGTRELTASDLKALDDYIHRCKLGPFRPGRMAALVEEVNSAPSSQQREQAARNLQKLRLTARQELGKLRRIQGNRLAQGAIDGALPQASTRATSPGKRVRRCSDNANNVVKTGSKPNASSAPLAHSLEPEKRREVAVTSWSDQSTASGVSGCSNETLGFSP